MRKSCKSLFFNIFKPRRTTIVSDQIIHGGCQLSPNGRLLAFEGLHSIGIYGCRAKKLLAKFKNYNSKVRCLTFFPNSAGLLVAWEDGSITSFDFEKQTDVSSSVLVQDLHSIVISPDNKYFLTTTSNGIIDLWSLENVTQLKKLDHDHKQPSASYCNASFHPTENFALIACCCGLLCLYDLRDINNIKSVELFSQDTRQYEISRQAVFIPNTRSILIYGIRNKVKLMNLDTKDYTLINNCNCSYGLKELTSDGKYVLFDDLYAGIKIFDLSNLNDIKQVGDVCTTNYNLSYNLSALQQTCKYYLSDNKLLVKSRSNIRGLHNLELFEFDFPESLTLAQLVLILKLNEFKVKNLIPFDLMSEDFYSQIFQSFSEDKQKEIINYFGLGMEPDEFSESK